VVKYSVCDEVHVRFSPFSYSNLNVTYCVDLGLRPVIVETVAELGPNLGDNSNTYKKWVFFSWAEGVTAHFGPHKEYYVVVSYI
jgi:hypothetical protein